MTTITDSEPLLVERARAGDRSAFEELVRRTSGYLFARIYLETGDRHRAEDLVQETFLRAYRSIAKLAEGQAFRRWLWTIGQNAVIDAARTDHRRKKAEPALKIAQAAKPSESPPPGDEMERAETRDQVLRILRSLPEEYRLPLTLRYIAGSDYESIQTQLGLTNGSLRGLLHRGMKLLREKMQAPSGESP